jgi:predicted DCC family thiol-disulfide oxidoreductase YuxK
MSAIIFFDGVCNFCDRSVQFIFQRDNKGYFQFCPLQSEKAELLLSQSGGSSSKDGALYTVMLLENGKIYERSTAALRMARKLNKTWPLLYILMIVPRPIRDFVYAFIAKNRYKWFGKKESCMIPSAELRSRFIL